MWRGGGKTGGGKTGGGKTGGGKTGGGKTEMKLEVWEYQHVNSSHKERVNTHHKTSL